MIDKPEHKEKLYLDRNESDHTKCGAQYLKDILHKAVGKVYVKKTSF